MVNLGEKGLGCLGAGSKSVLNFWLKRLSGVQKVVSF
jgi:hypothetical protein